MTLAAASEGLEISTLLVDTTELEQRLDMVIVLSENLFSKRDRMFDAVDELKLHLFIISRSLYLLLAVEVILRPSLADSLCN